MIAEFLSNLELGYDEVKVAFEGLDDESLWVRPTSGLLSVGELAAHVAYWEAVMLSGEGGDPEPDLAKCRVSSPLIDSRFRYYFAAIASPPTDQQRAMTADQVLSELVRVHKEATAYFRELAPDLSSSAPGFPPGQTYGWLLRYAVFHVSYHAGQMYSVRHILGDATPDN